MATTHTFRSSESLRRRSLWSRWTVATIAGEGLGFMVPALAGATAYAAGLTDWWSIAVLVPGGAVEGAILGLAQGSVLHRELAGFDRRAFAFATAVAAALAWAVGMPLGAFGPSLTPPALVVATAVGGTFVLLSIGVAQALVLRRHVARTRTWIEANALAWLVGLSIPLAAMSLVDDADPPAVVALTAIAAGVAMAAVVAAITGVAIVRLLGTHEAIQERP